MMLTNEILFYGGITLAVVAVIGYIIFGIVFYIGKIKLNVQFDKEYGEVRKIKKSDK